MEGELMMMGRCDAEFVALRDEMNALAQRAPAIDNQLLNDEHEPKMPQVANKSVLKPLLLDETQIDVSGGRMVGLALEKSHCIVMVDVGAFAVALDAEGREFVTNVKTDLPP